MTVAKLLPLALLIAAGLFAVSPANLAWPGWPRPGALGETLRLPGDRLLPVLAGAAILWVLSQATADELKLSAGVVVAASAFYLLRPWRTAPAASAP